MIGRTLEHYQILEPLGAGGMGEVYKARDTRLNRLVAIKILRQDLAASESRKQRFLLEAKSASALNHPNIVTIHEFFQVDVEGYGAMDCLVMEYLTGRTLNALIPKTGMKLQYALSIAVQVAEGLRKAHAAGIVHRDIKPSNILVPDDGPVKILDFGVAKLTEPETLASVESTLTAALTEAGSLVGTVAYMSPEQAQGRAVDARSDIFSFGAVLYEMIAGQHAFRQDSTVGTLGAILHTEPAPIANPAASRALLRLIQKCLRKNPDDRWQHMSDVKQLLDDIVKDGELLDDSLSGTGPATAVPKPRRAAWIVPAACAIAGALIAYAALRFLPAADAGREPAAAVLQMVTADSGLTGYPAISRDGKFIAFASDRAKQNNLDIWVQQIGGRDPIRLTSDPADESDPAFSPDGAMIAFRSEKDGGGIYLVPSLGGSAVLLAPLGRNPRFSPDGKWVAYSAGGEAVSNPGSAGVFIVNAGGGVPRAIHAEMATATNPVWSPNSDKLLVLGRKDWKAPARAELDWWVLPIDGGAPVRTGAYARMDAQKLLQSHFPQGWPTALDWQKDDWQKDDGRKDDGGEILFGAFTGEAANLWQISLNGNGPPQRLTLAPGLQGHAAWSGDGRRLVFAAEQLNFDVWMQSLDRSTGAARGDLQRLTEEATEELAPSISWDASQIAFMSRRSDNWSLRIRNGPTGAERTVLSSAQRLRTATLSGDGSRVFYTNELLDLLAMPSAGGPVERLCEHCGTVMGASTDGREALYEPVDNEDVMAYDAARRAAVKLAARPQPDLILSSARFSRDSKWIAFHALHNATNTAQIFIAPTENPSAWIPITDGTKLERDPAWSPDGRFLYFISERDGFRCIWARPLNPVTKQPAGDAFAVRHFHSARFSLRHVASQGYLTGLSVGEGALVFSMGELTGNVWLEER